MTKNVTITEFLTARLDEDEAVARRADDFEVEEFTWASVDYWCASNEEHGMRWSPRRVLADVAAKRAILGTLLDEGGERMFDDIFRLLALPYAEHPDYDEGWRP
jgi:hypothetical protein